VLVARPVEFPCPPATSTEPLGNSVARWNVRARASVPAGDALIVVTSISSAVAVLDPLAIKRPDGSNVAVCSDRAVARLPPGVQVPVEGS
jgi:hypothetical protein